MDNKRNRNLEFGRDNLDFRRENDRRNLEFGRDNCNVEFGRDKNRRNLEFGRDNERRSDNLEFGDEFRNDFSRKRK